MSGIVIGHDVCVRTHDAVSAFLVSSEFEVSLHVSPFSSELIAALVDISSTVFGDIEPDYVEWRVRNMPEAMARLNLRYGFEVCGVRAEPGRTQVLYSKALG